jgi:hypothetical protein
MKAFWLASIAIGAQMAIEKETLECKRQAGLL